MKALCNVRRCWLETFTATLSCTEKRSCSLSIIKLILHHHILHIYFSPAPNPLPLLGGGLTVLPLRLASFPSLPSAASRSKKSCHSSASDSLLLELLAISMGSDMELSDGVLGVRRNGDIGTPRREDVPGRARPACSFCSGECQYKGLVGVRGVVTYRPSSRAAWR